MKDKLVEEIRARRRRLFREKYGCSVDGLVRGAMAWEREHPDRAIRKRHQRPAAV